MVETKIEYFGSPLTSKFGFLRGLVLMLFLLPLYFVFYRYVSSDYPMFATDTITWVVGGLLYLLVTVSAIGVQVPSSGFGAMLYGISIGFVLHSIFNITLYVTGQKRAVTTIAVDLLFGSAACGSASWFIYRNRFLYLPKDRSR
jgi:hypothetical protein